MTVTQATAGRFEIGRVIKGALAIWRENLTVVTLLMVVLAIAPSALFGWLRNNISSFDPTDVLATAKGLPGENIATGLLSIWLTIALLSLSKAYWAGEKLRFGQALSAGGRHLLPVFGLGILSGLGMILGFLLLIVPGLFLMVVWSVVTPAKVIEDRGVFASFTRSLELTKGYRWPIFALILIYLAVFLGFFAIAGALVGIIQVLSGQDITVIFDAVISPVLVGMVTVLAALGSASIYRELVQIKEGGEASEVAAVFA